MTQHDDVDFAPRSTRARRTRMAAALLAVLATLAACSGAPEQTPSPGEASPVAGLPSEAPPDTSEEPPEAEDGPGFTATTLDGDQIESASFAGTPVVLWFWAPWCTICQAEGPGLAEVAAEFEGQIEFVGVAGLGSVEEMQVFVTDTGTDGLVHMVDDDGSIWQRFGVVATPSHGFVTSEGDVEIERGWLRAADLRERAQELLD